MKKQYFIFSFSLFILIIIICWISKFGHQEKLNSSKLLVSLIGHGKLWIALHAAMWNLCNQVRLSVKSCFFFFQKKKWAQRGFPVKNEGQKGETTLSKNKKQKKMEAPNRGLPRGSNPLLLSLASLVFSLSSILSPAAHLRWQLVPFSALPTTSSLPFPVPLSPSLMRYLFISPRLKPQHTHDHLAPGTTLTHAPIRRAQNGPNAQAQLRCHSVAGGEEGGGKCKRPFLHDSRTMTNNHFSQRIQVLTSSS